MSYRTWKFLEGKTSKGITVTLRPLHIDDVDLIGEWRNMEEMRQLVSADYPVSYEAVREWVQKMISNTHGNPTDIALGICVEERLIGTAGIHGISLRHRHATLGICVGETDFRNQGIGSAVYELLLRYIFRELDLRALCAFVYGHNEPSKRLHMRLGFAQVGCIPEWQGRDGEYQDLLTYHISKEAWLAMQK